MYSQTKTNFISNLLFGLLLLLLTPFLVMSKDNPVMVINCAEFLVGPEFEALTVINFPCDNGTCPTGTVPFIDDNGCECVPDCSTVVPYNDNNCMLCDGMGGSEWSNFYDACGCFDDGFIACGCPPWFSPIVDISVGFSGCEIPDVPCFDGDIMWSSEGECGEPDDDGLVTVTVTIQLPQLGDGTAMPGYALTITDLENCLLTSGENFVVELAAEYGTDAAFVDDDNDGEIVLIFRRNPTLPTVINFQNDNQDISIAPCAPIPTLGTWALVILGFLMTIFGLLVIRNVKVIHT